MAGEVLHVYVPCLKIPGKRKQILNTQPNKEEFKITENPHKSRDNGFDVFGLSPAVLKTLRKLEFDTPTPIQREAIPLVLQGHDLMGLAQTGTGKTAAFGLPLIEQLMGRGSKPEPKHVRALILTPTRELANQITANLKAFVRNTHLSVASVVGGLSINSQARTLAQGKDILVATPGRLLDLIERKALYLDKAQFLVLDEADQMLDLGFIHALKRIAKLVARERQTLLFSATMPKDIEKLAQAYLTDPVRVEVTPPGKAADKITQSVHHVDRRNKPGLLAKLLAENPDDLSLVFARTKHGAEKLKRLLEAKGFAAGSIHGNKSQGQRDKAIKGLKSGEIRILVATDVAARGIDIPGITHVYNYDLPEVPAAYVHRIGRTARAGAEGKAVAFCAPDELHLLKAIEKEMKMAVPVTGAAFSAEEAKQGAAEAKEAKKEQGRRQQGRGRGRSGGSGNSSGGRKGRPDTSAKTADRESGVAYGRKNRAHLAVADRNLGADEAVGNAGTSPVGKAGAKSGERSGQKNRKPRWKRSVANGSKFRKRNTAKA